MTVDILIPTYCRPTALAVTLTSLIAQTYRDFRVVISDQTEDSNSIESGEVQAVLRVLQSHGHVVEVYKNLPRRGIAQQRQFLLEQAKATYALFLDDDLILEPFVVENMLVALQEENCGFVGSAVIGLSFINDIRPHEQKIEFWNGPVQPEVVKSDTSQWERWRLHNAANLYHIQKNLDLTPDRQRKYRVAWVGACVMYDTEKLRGIGGYSFWQQLPSEHCGEDVLVQLRLMELYGGCGIIPSGVYHQELPTTIIDRSCPANKYVELANG
ncbi:MULTISPECIES: glycosyltransferase family 2 protein [Nostocales]|uniref:Glycosyl transferase n=3 Tax=Nostocales TaxID=1161 RepID=A0A0C1R9I7_9CYAN|nr:glycosyltransferase family A protein [Tolypothrix bouteillei]KAF3885357.1 glycosyltransferase family 2 protein [Tolypothrix bouteillei VB521301]